MKKILTIITIIAVIIIISNVFSHLKQKRVEAWEAMTPQEKIAEINNRRANDCPKLDEAYLVACNQMYNDQIDNLNQ